MKKLIYILALLGILTNDVKAQTPETMPTTTSDNFLYKDLFFIGYEMGFPVNHDFLTKVSFAGGHLSYRRMITPHWSAGIAISWNTFDQYTNRQTYQLKDGSGAITTDMIKYVYTFPITATGHYYFNGRRYFKPYVGLGLGAQYSEQSLYFNIYSNTEYNWGFVMRPAVGAIFPFNDIVGLYVDGSYSFATNKNDGLKIDNLQHFAIQVGVSLSVQ